MSIHSALNAYRTVSTGSGIENAKPHQLIQMLLGGALARVATAKGHTMRNEIAEKGIQVGKAISIIDGLTTSLNAEGGELSANLHNLYDYIGRRLLEANVANDPEIFDEVTSLLQEIKSGWDLIGAEVADSASTSEPNF